jgi:multiple antibiotic resistance protein
MDIYHYIQAAVTMTAVINPMVAGVMLLQMEAGRSNRDKISLTVKTTAITTAILIGSAIMGQMILKFFGISLEVFRIVGGLIIAYIGFRMLSGQMLQSVDVKESNSLNDLIMFMASPGSIATAITLSAVHSPKSFPVTAVVAVLFAMLFTLAEIIIMIKMSKSIDMKRQRLTTQFMGVIIISMGLQFALEGYKQFMAL